MTNNKSIEQELENTKLALKMTAQMSQFKSGFLARVSHELRSPLSSLLSLHQLILSDLCENPQEEREFIQQSYDAATKLMKLIDQIITVSKIEYGRQKLIIESLNVNRFLADLHHLTHLQVANFGLKLEITGVDDHLCMMADQKRIQQAFVMLVDSIISNLEEGTIRLSVINVNTETIAINLDFPGNIHLWNEPVDFIQKIPEANPKSVKDFTKTLEFSPGMKLILAQDLIETMNGSLKLTELTLNEKKIKRLQCLLPLGSDEM